MSILEQALQYARLGLRVIRLYGVHPDGRCHCNNDCTRPGKHPNLGRGWQELATCNPQIIRRWYTDCPQANVGIKTGDGILALDEDGETGQRSLEELQRLHGPLPETARSRTNSGHHYLFRVADGCNIPNSQGSIAPGLDIRGDGPGQIVAPPSIHKSGHVYHWKRHPSEGIADCPEWLLQLIEKCSSEKVPQKGISEARRRTENTETARKPPEPIQRAGKAKEGPSRATSSGINWHNRHAALLKVILRRYPVSPGGNSRYGQMVRAVGSLVGRGVSEQVIKKIMYAWLDHFEPIYEHEREEAGNQLDLCIHYTKHSPSFQFSSEQDHVEACKKIQLTPFQEWFLSTECDSLHSRVREGEKGGEGKLYY